jgi:2,4-diaminopentanoate dehydrogenase
VGELINQPLIGIRVTGSKEEIFNMDADCVVFTPQHVMEESAVAIQDQDLISILRSGKSVVTPTQYFYPHFHGDAYVKRIEDACREGSSCLFTAGENPGFWLERVALTLTGLCHDVEYIKVSEYADVSVMRLDTLMAVGFGQTPEMANKTAEFCTAHWERWFWADCLNMVSKSLFGRVLDKMEAKPIYHIAEKEIVFDKALGDPFDLVIKPGDVQSVSYQYTGYLDGKVRLIDTANWYILEKGSPFPGKEDAVWDIEIEGKPSSIKCSTKVKASIEDNLECWPGDPTVPTTYATIMPVLQAIPIVCSDREPGIVYPSIFTSCVDDFRTLESRKNIVDIG